MAAPASLHAAQTMLGGATSALSTGVQHGLATLLPALAVGLAAHSIDKAAAELERPEATFSDKVFALARAVGDTVRIVDVVVGTVISAVAAAASAGWAWFKAWRRR